MTDDLLYSPILECHQASFAESFATAEDLARCLWVVRCDAIDQDPRTEASVACEGLVRKVRLTSEVCWERETTSPGSTVQLQDLQSLGFSRVSELEGWRVAGG